MTSKSAEEIYDSLRTIFANRTSDQVLEIEILTPELGPLLQDGLCIGITKAALVKAFLVARQKLTKYLIQWNESTSGHGPTFLEQSDGVKDLAIATQMILLFDCEHVTACNWRKRFISSSLQEHHTIECDTLAIEEILETERSLTTSFLCSPLHRHTKSPTLWQHRLWILAKLLDLQEQRAGSHKISDDFSRRVILEELSVVCKSAQLHPRNYYAFSYMRQLHALVCQYSSPRERTLPEEDSANNSQLALAIVMVEPMLTWCLSSPSDISGWMYLFYLLDHHDVRSASFALGDEIVKERKLVVKRTIHFAVHIATWEGESLWTFVDLMVARFGVDILPTVGANGLKLEDISSSSSSGARWQRTRSTVYKVYEGIRDLA